MSIVSVSMTSLQNLIEGEKFYRRDFQITKEFLKHVKLPYHSPVYSTTYRCYVNGQGVEDYSAMDQYENTLHEQGLNYSLTLFTQKHVYTAYRTQPNFS